MGRIETFIVSPSEANGREHQSLGHAASVIRRNHRADLAAADAARREAERERDELRAQYGTELQEMIRRGEELRKKARQPRVRSL